MRRISNKIGIATAALAIAAGITVTLFRHWEPSGESWGYWLFARIFSETGKFVITDRGPLYTLYLNIFRLMRYPSSVVVEYAATSLITAGSLIILLRRRTGLMWAAFAVLLWIPFFQDAEPPTQNLALACSCLAIAVRDAGSGRFRFAFFYALLGFAYMMRPSYMIFLIIFAIWDSVKSLGKKDVRGFMTAIRPKLADWPITIALILLVWFTLEQSPHKWNTASFTDTKWFPNNCKSLSEGSFFQTYNWHYIIDRYKTFKDRDFYFTNQELFGGASSMAGAIRANPVFIATHMARNTVATFYTGAGLTMLPRFLCKRIPHLGYFNYIILLFLIIPFICAILYGAFRACESKNMRLFLAANVFILAGTAVVGYPKPRYMHPAVPIYILSAFWYGRYACGILTRSSISFRSTHWLRSGACNFIMLSALIFFSNGLTDWASITKEIAKDALTGEIAVMEKRPYSMKASFKSLEPLIQRSNGVLALEHLFIGAFMDVPLGRIYDVWEIPPFGYFGNSDYAGLRPGRIDCVLISNELATDVGPATNYQIRYENYIKAYAEKLRDMGAGVYDIKAFGRAVILSNHR